MHTGGMVVRQHGRSRVAQLVGEAFPETFDLHLEIHADLLLLVQLRRQLVEALLVHTPEGFELAAKLLDFGVNVACVRGGMRRPIYTEFAQ